MFLRQPLDDRLRSDVGAHCPIDSAMMVLGSRNAMLTLREAHYGTTRFNDFAKRVGMSTATTAANLRSLTAAGLLKRRPYQEAGARVRDEYVPTQAGLELVPIVVGLFTWGQRHTGAGPEFELAHAGCGAAAQVRVTCAAGHDVDSVAIELRVSDTGSEQPVDEQPPEYAESPDGTPIAFRRFGSGRPVVIVGGALSTAAASGPLAASLAEAGLQGVVYDRRGRGASGDIAPYAPERETEDLRAVIDAIGSPVAVLGHSSGAVLSLFAAATGVPMTHLFLSEPPLRFGHDEPPADLADRLQSLVDQGRSVEAVLLFLREDVHLPEEAIGELRASDLFAEIVGLAQTAIYDQRLVAAVSTPTPAAMLAIKVPTTVLRGDPTVPFLITTAERLAAAIPGAELVVVPESHDHRVDPRGTTREVVTRLQASS